MHVHAKHYKLNEDGRTAPSVCGNGSVPLSHSVNVVTRIGIHTQTHTEKKNHYCDMDGRTAPRAAAMDTFRSGAGERRYESWTSLPPEHITF